MSRIEIPSFTAATALAARRMVKIDTSATDVSPAKITYCGATGIPHAVTRQAGAKDEKIAVDMFPGRNGSYEVEVTISTAINVGTALYCGASGKLTEHAATNSYLVAIAVEQAAADNDHVQVIPNNIVTFATTT
jgi:hypothetical protein